MLFADDDAPNWEETQRVQLDPAAMVWRPATQRP